MEGLHFPVMIQYHDRRKEQQKNEILTRYCVVDGLPEPFCTSFRRLMIRVYKSMCCLTVKYNLWIPHVVVWWDANIRLRQCLVLVSDGLVGDDYLPRLGASQRKCHQTPWKHHFASLLPYQLPVKQSKL